MQGFLPLSSVKSIALVIRFYHRDGRASLVARPPRQVAMPRGVRLGLTTLTCRVTVLSRSVTLGQEGAVRVVGYIRVSSRNVEHQRDSAAEQERVIRAWCKAEGHKLVRLYRDVGVSGTNGLADRVGLPDAEAAIQAGEADGLVVRELDRLHRDMMIQEQVFADLWRIRPEIEIFSTKGGEQQNCRRDDPDDPSRLLIRRVLGAVAQYVRDQTVARLRAGKRRKAEAGGFVGGQPAFGQRAENKALTVDEAEAATVARIRALRASGASLRAIAATLQAEGRPPKRGDRWHPTTVGRVLARYGE
jgi:DNA invertase Pin-like site-specific DNA recombinase